MPAAAVIPAPLAYTIIVAVKRLVVGLNYIIIVIVITITFVVLLTVNNLIINSLIRLFCLKELITCYTHTQSLYNKVIVVVITILSTL